MSCCGKRRAAVRTSRSPLPSAPPPVVDDAEEPTAGVAVEYRGQAPALYRARDGDRLYAFSPGRRVRRLPRSDAQLLLRSRLFRLGAQQE